MLVYVLISRGIPHTTTLLTVLCKLGFRFQSSLLVYSVIHYLKIQLFILSFLVTACNKILLTKSHCAKNCEESNPLLRIIPIAARV